MAPGLASMARAGWVDAVERGAIVKGTHPTTVADWIALADAMFEIGVDPSALLNAIEPPLDLVDVVRAAWTYAAANRSY